MEVEVLVVVVIVEVTFSGVNQDSCMPRQLSILYVQTNTTYAWAYKTYLSCRGFFNGKIKTSNPFKQ